MTKTSHPYISTLDSVKAVAIIMIVVSHLGHWGLYFDNGAECGVAIFFTLSGFGLSLGYGAKVEKGWSTLQFVWSRLKRFYPLHLVMLVLCSALFYGDEWRKLLAPITANLLLLQSWRPLVGYQFSCNQVSWFLSDLMLMYFLFAPMYRWLVNCSWRAMGWRFALMLIVYFAAIQLVPTESINEYIYVFPLLRIPNFAAGIVTYRLCLLLRQRLSTSAQHRVWRTDLFVIGAIVLTVGALLAYPYVSVRYGCSSLFWVPSMLLILALYGNALRPDWLTRALSFAPLAWIGRHSFFIFMTHLYIIELAYKLLNPTQ